MSVFYKGMDLSFVPQGEAEGMVIKDFDETVMDPLDLAAKYGVNAVRLRLWNQPENVPEAKGYCGIEDTIAMAKRIRAHGMSFMLDFHYSDFWADPGNQTKPLAWKGLHGGELEEAVYRFTRDMLMKLEAEGVLPDIVQIGNEIRSGLLFPDGELPDVQGMVKLVNAGIRAARAVADADRMQIMIHLDQGGRYRFISDWFTNALQEGMDDFDVIGLSYYPFWHGTFADLKDTMERLIKDFHKPIMVVETAHAWRCVKDGFVDEAQVKIAGIAASEEGQKKVVDIIMNIVASLPDEMGQGVYYWEPLCMPCNQGGWSDNMGILNEDGRILEAVKSFMFTRQQACPNKIARIYELEKQVILTGTMPVMKKKAQILYYNGELKEYKIKWKLPADTGWNTKPANIRIEGSIEVLNEKVYQEVELADRVTEGENLIQNADFHRMLEGWDVQVSNDKTETKLEGDVLSVYSPMNFRFTISQAVDIEEAGVYKAKVNYRGVDTTNVDVRLFVETASQYQDQVIHPTDDDWTAYELGNISCRKGRAVVGIKIVSPPIYGKIKGLCLERMGE